MSHPAILETKEAFGEITHIADPAHIVALCRYFKDEEKFIRLSGLTAVDWHPSEPRFEVVYFLHSIERFSSTATFAPSISRNLRSPATFMPSGTRRDSPFRTMEIVFVSSVTLTPCFRTHYIQ